jgi:hypothetical protein
MTTATSTHYALEGRLLEVCDCNILCPCWVGGDADNGTCDAIVGWRVDKGTAQGVDVSGLTLALAVHIPGNILQGNWKVMAYMDDKATDEQQEAMVNAFTGKLGGPLADLAQLIGEVVGLERVPIKFEVEKGKGIITIGNVMQAELESLTGATGQATTLHDTIFTTIPGSPAFVGKATNYQSSAPTHGHGVNLKGSNAVQGSFRFEF